MIEYRGSCHLPPLDTKRKHISVCICTFKRPHLLRRALEEIDRQQTEGLFTYSVVVADNDRLQSAKDVVTHFAATSELRIDYRVEPEQNIALARNKALEGDSGDFIAFVDDDEYPAVDWLCRLFKACQAYNVAGALGPVRPYFEHDPPQWVIKGKFFDRPAYETGRQMEWTETRTGNVLFDRSILDGVREAFRPEFGAGSEDLDFFRRMIDRGYVFVWCNEAAVYEWVPPSRCTVRYLLQRAITRGSNFPHRPVHRVRNITKSIIAIPIYALVLPFAAVSGKHLFIKYLIKLVDHGSRMLAFLGCRMTGARQM
jgi:succinoglycan biosynthesis protein ExoM